MTTPVALYLQDAHDIREGTELVRYAEEQGFDASSPEPSSSARRRGHTW
jgi:hypothetical protein